MHALKKLLFILAFLPVIGQAQITQTIRGKVVDAVSQRPLPGANVVVLDTNNFMGAATDLDGNFKLENVPIGKVDLKISFLGYAPKTLEHLVLTPAKQLILNIELAENFNELKEVVVKADKYKGKPLNEMATVSTRTFSVEETRRFAGSWQDPARAAAAFAGVSGGTDERNDIIIRGNSPTSVLWRLEDINIPNPNHLSFSGATGGPVSILNNNLLADSDFFTGAFPAEYGNANAGVFDLRLRKGNNEKREYYLQLGLNGLEAGLEGPFSKKSKASYLISYRYSTMALISFMGINLGVSAIPFYQDLTYNFSIPTKKAGRFSLWGIGGLSNIHLEDNPGHNGGAAEKRDQKLGSDMGVAGLSHHIFMGEKTNVKTTVAFSGLRQWQNKIVFQETDSSTTELLENFNNNVTLTASVHSRANVKFNSRTSIRIGVIYDHKWINYLDSSYFEELADHRVLLDVKANLGLAQLYSQVKHRFTEKLTGVLGLHGQMSTLNSQFSIEPRAGFTWAANAVHSVHFGAGMHSQMLPTLTYFFETYLPDENRYIRTNEDLGFSKSVHGILGHDWNIWPKLRLKTEVYYQYLYSIPVESTPSYFSLVNAGEAIGDVQVADSLVNQGTATNMGLEMTIEKFFSMNYYFLISGSLYNSKYEGSDRQKRNTAFNGKYNATLLGGYKLKISKKNSLSFDTKVTWTAGARYVPIDLDASRAAGRTIRDHSQAYEEKYRDYFRADLKFTLALNGKRASHNIAIDLQNILNTKNIFNVVYNEDTGQLDTKYQLGFLPLVYYRVEF